MSLEELRKASKIKKTDVEASIKKVESMVSYINTRERLGIINLEDNDDLFTKEVFINIKNKYGLSKEEALKIDNYNAEVFKSIGAIVKKIIKSVVDFIKKLFGQGSYPSNKDSVVDEAEVDPDDISKKETDAFKLMANVKNYLDNNVIGNNIKSGVTELIYAYEKLLNGEDPGFIATNITSALLNKAKKEDLNEDDNLKSYTREYRYVFNGWRVEHGKILSNILVLTYSGTALLKVTPITVEEKLKDIGKLSVKETRKILKFFIINKLEEKVNKALVEKLEEIGDLADDLELEKIDKLYGTIYGKPHYNTVTVLDSISKTVVPFSKFIATKEKYHKKAFVILEDIKANKVNTESEITPVSIDNITETEDEKQLLSNMFNMEDDSLKPAAYNDVFKHIKKLAWIDVKTLGDTKLRARLLEEQVANRNIPLRLNKELTKLHFLWILSKDYGMSIIDIMSEYNLAMQSMTNYISGNVKSSIKTSYSTKLLNILDTPDLKKIPKYDSRTGMYNNRSARLETLFVNYNVNIQTAKHGRLQYIPTITMLVQVIDTDTSAIVKNTFITKELRKTMVTKDTLPMIIKKILVMLKNDIFTNKKVAMFLKSIDGVEKAVNGIKNINNSPIMKSYIDTELSISTGAVGSIISSDISAIIGMTKNVIEYNRLKTYFLNEVARKSING